MNPITHCLDRLNLGDDVKLKQRAEHFQGLLSGISNKIFDKGPNLKSVICIQLAYESLNNYDWDVKLAAELAGCSPLAYESASSIARQRLDLHPVVTMDMLTVALGSTTMLSHANGLWKSLIINYLSKLSGVKKINAQKELEQSCWKGAIIFICAKAFGNTIDKNKLHSICGCSMVELNKSIKVVKETCDEEISKLKNGSTSISKRRAVSSSSNQEQQQEEADTNKKKKVKMATSKKRKISEVVEEKPVTKLISGVASMINYIDYRNTRSFSDYEKWKSNLIESIKTKT